MSTLTIASFNFAAQAMPWQRQTFAGRLGAIAESVDYYHPAVLCGQEAGSLSRVKALTQVFKDDVRGKMRRAPGGRSWKYIWYDSDQVILNDSGSMKLNRTGTKRAAWVKVTSRITGETFFITSPHLSASFLGSDATRRREAAQLVATSAKLNPANHPEIHAGDFNSVRDVGKTMVKLGMLDAIACAASWTRSGFNTFNGRSTVAPHQSTQKIDGEHLDHIYVSADLSRRITLWSQRPSVAASDHNIIAIKVAL